MGLKKISFITGFAFCLFSLALLAEGKKKNGNKESAKAKVTQVQAQESQTPGTTTAPSTVIATVGNTKLTYGELQAFKKFFAPMGAEEERLINFWKLNAALAEKARKENIDKNPEAQAVMQIAWDQVMGSIYIRYKQLQVSITDQEVKEYYNQHQNDREFRENEFVSAKLIAAEKREQADQIKKQLVEGSDFDKLAEENREQTLKITGLSDIELKNIAIDQLYKPLGAGVALSMGRATLNEINGPRQTPNGWVIFKVTARTPGKLIPLEKLEKDIREMMLRRKQMQVRTDLVQEAEKTAGVKMEAPRQPRMPLSTRPARPVR